MNSGGEPKLVSLLVPGDVIFDALNQLRLILKVERAWDWDLSRRSTPTVELKTFPPNAWAFFYESEEVKCL